MSLDYGAGAALCKSSALAHRSAAYILKAFGGQMLGFAVSHAALAEEEASKAVFCAMVSKELVTPDTIKRVFREHPPKVYLFHALQRKKVVEMTDSTSEEPPAFVRINKQPLTSQPHSSIEKEDAPVLREHDADRNAEFYVGYNNDTWQSPGEGCSDDPTKLVYRYAHRADAMLLIGEVLLGITGKVSLAHNFRITETANGWECTPDEISSD